MNQKEKEDAPVRFGFIEYRRLLAQVPSVILQLVLELLLPVIVLLWHAYKSVKHRSDVELQNRC